MYLFAKRPNPPKAYTKEYTRKFSMESSVNGALRCWYTQPVGLKIRHILEADRKRSESIID